MEKLKKRAIAGLNSENVVSMTGPWLEMFFRPLGLLGSWYFFHDKVTASWIKRHRFGGETILHCFDGSCTSSIRSARKRGVTTFLEITLPMCANEIISQEYELAGIPQPKRKLGTEPSVQCIKAQMEESDYVVAQSWYTVNYLIRYGIRSDRIILQPLGVDTNRFFPSLSQTPKKTFRVLFSGQISIRKGLYYLLEAWKRLNLPNSELLLTGWPIDSYAVELLARYRGIYNWLGFVKDDELPQVYRSCDVFVFPSLAEGGSNVVNEALASGLPCVISMNASSAVRDGVEGYVVPIRDVDSLMDRIVRLYRSASLVDRMSVAARQRAERLTWHDFGRRLVIMYREKLATQNGQCGVLDMTDR